MTVQYIPHPDSKGGRVYVGDVSICDVFERKNNQFEFITQPWVKNGGWLEINSKINSILVSSIPDGLEWLKNRLSNV